MLDEDPDLGRGLDGPRRAEVQARAVAPLVRLVPGKADIATLVSAGEDDLGALVLDGLLARTVRLGGRSSIELLGSEDLLRPRDDFVDPPSLRATITWTVMQPTRLAVLDQAFARRIAPWLPAVAPVLLERAVRRARHLTLRVSIVEMKRIEERLLLLLWLLADRWGRMQSDGVCLPLRLTHEVLGRMVCAHRSSVTTALKQLLQKGAVSQGAEGFLLLQDAAGAGLGTSGGWPDATTCSPQWQRPYRP